MNNKSGSLFTDKTLTYRINSELLDGIKAGIPIAVGYTPIAITFGLLAKSSGISNATAVLMSLIVLAGAAQFVGVQLIALGAGFWEIVITTFILNFRHFLMSSLLAQRIEKTTPKGLMLLLSYAITDETFSVASMGREGKINPMFMLGLNFMAAGSWISGTWLGVFLGAGLPQTLQTSMNIALYSMFIGLLVPALRESRPALVVALSAVVINCVLTWVPFFEFLSSGWTIIISTILAAIIGVILFPHRGDKA